MVSMQQIENETELRYKSLPPDGGWGYLITLSVIVMCLVTIVPLGAFGLLYGNFLASVGDETTGTTLTNGIFNTVQSFTGLASNYLLQKYSYREVGLLGAILYFLGALGTIFVTSLPQMIISFGVLEGLGFGLMTPASFSALNSYFEEKLNLMMGIAQALLVLETMIFPVVAALLVDNLGFRGAMVVLACLALLNIPAMGILQPVKWHLKKVPIETLSINDAPSKPASDELSRTQTVPLLNKQMEEVILMNSDSNRSSLGSKFKDIIIEPNRRMSALSFGDRAVSITTINNLEQKQKNSLLKCMDLNLFKNPKYLNVSFGIALCFNSDIAFNSIIPLVLHNIGFEKSNIALMMMVYFGSDLVSRILLLIVSVVCRVRNRYVFLAGAFLSAVFRTAFVMYDTYTWRMVTLAFLGFLRCLIQTPMVLVIADEYKDNFSSAFSLYMVVCGCVSLTFVPLMNLAKNITKSDDMVIHVLTIAFLLCSISWTVELLWTKVNEKCVKKERVNR